MGELLHQFGVHWTLLIAQIVNFTLLFLVLRAFVFKPIVAALDARREKIEGATRHADVLAEKNAAAEIEMRAMLEKARAEAHAIVADAGSTAKEEAKHILAGAHAEAEAIVREAKLTLAKERELLHAQVRDSVMELVIATTKKLLGTELPKDVYERSLAAAVDDVKHAKG